MGVATALRAVFWTSVAAANRPPTLSESQQISTADDADVHRLVGCRSAEPQRQLFNRGLPALRQICSGGLRMFADQLGNRNDVAAVAAATAMMVAQLLFWQRAVANLLTADYTNYTDDQDSGAQKIFQEQFENRLGQDRCYTVRELARYESA